MTLGRSRTATVRVEHESVSRSHALLTFERGNALLKDLNSSNGTFVAGKRILNEARLGPTETIQLGAAVVSFRLIPPEQPSERTMMLDTGVGNVPEPAVLSPPSGPSPADGAAGTIPGALAGPPSPPSPPAKPSQAPPFEISAEELLHPPVKAPSGAEGPEGAQAALEAARGLPDGQAGFSSAPSPGRAALPVPVRPARPSSVADVPIGPDAPGVEVLSAPGVPAGFGQRFLAALVDGVILSAINFLLVTPVILIAVFLGSDPRGSGAPRWEVLAVAALSLILILAADLWYTIGGLARSGRTPGKALLKIIVVGPVGSFGPGLGYGKAFARTLYQIVGSIPLGLGTWMILFRKDRRAWHDVLAGTWVIKVP